MTKTNNPIHAGIAGASVPAIVLGCIGSLGAVTNLLLPLIYLGALALVLGSSAGWLTSRYWRKHRQAIAFVIGAGAMFGSLATAFLMWGNQPTISARMTDTQWVLLSIATDITSGILVQLFVLCVWLGLRWFVLKYRQGD